jgi:uncharacterized protein YcaQ
MTPIRKPGASALSCTAAQAAAFRLARHHLGGRMRGGGAGRPEVSGGSTVADVCRDTGGIQAQVMSAAELAVWTRGGAATRDDIHRALWERRDVVRTSAMRLTLHLIAAADFSTYIDAMRPMSTAILQRWQARVGARPDQVKAMIGAVLEGLGDGPRTQQELIALARKKAGKGVRAWLDHAWSAVRPAVIEGLIVYGPPRGAEATFVRADTWLPKQRTVDVVDARAELFRRFLSAFGPADGRDFSKWSGLRSADAKSAVDVLGDQIVRVSVDGTPGWILRADVDVLMHSTLDEGAVRLLGAFDSLLLAHATKEHLIAPQHYKRVYRPQGWISPVVLRGGTIAGVWFPRSSAQKTLVEVELFGRLTPAMRQGIERDAEEMGRFLGVRCEARFAPSQ